jgi:hypothetical protein
MAILSGRPSRSYANVEHNAEGLSAVGSAPFSNKKMEGGFKTYRPCECTVSLTWSHIDDSALVESHLRPLMYDPHPDSAFAPLPPAFQRNKHKKEAALAGQRAELDHILEPGYRHTDADGNSIAGPSRVSAARTAGGMAAERKPKISVRSSSSVSSFRSAGKKALGGVYVDSSGKVHDTEYDPFARVSEMSRKASRRRSAFGADKKKGSGSSSSGSDSEVHPPANGRKSVDGGKEREEEEIRRRLDMERRRLDEVSGYAASKRRSFASEKISLAGGRTTPSIRSSEDGDHLTVYSALERQGRAQTSQGYYRPSPLSPTFGDRSSTHSYSTARTPLTNGTMEEEEDGAIAGDETPEKATETTQPMAPPPPPQPKERIEIRKEGSRKITGFDAPSSPMPPSTPAMTAAESLRPPDSARSGGSRASSDRDREPRPKPVQRPREELFPETPAQMKKREERERRVGRAPLSSSRVSGLAVDTGIASRSTARVLPEIEIVEDDDPRIIFPPSEKARTTKIQTTHDHVIRGPFSHAINATGGMAGSSIGERRASSARSVPFSGGAASGPSSILEEGPGGYLPSRWASGDKQLRLTEDEKEMYRPREWGGKKGELGGRTEEWR